MDKRFLDNVFCLDAVTNEKYEPPKNIEPNISPELDAIICRALYNNRDRRFESAREMQAHIRDEFSKFRTSKGKTLDPRVLIRGYLEKGSAILDDLDVQSTTSGKVQGKEKRNWLARDARHDGYLLAL